jgi:hypothetical protein
MRVLRDVIVLFKHLLERPWNKVSGWKGQGLSKKRREILIKSVLQAISSYAMGCSQLSKTMCKKLKSVAAQLGAADGQRKLHWVSWKKICNPKSKEGMGFQNYTC